MKQLLVISTLLLTVFVQGCATERYVVDTKGIDEEQYKTDLAECTEYREEVDNTVPAAESAGAGALVGSALGAIIGNSDLALELGAMVAIQAGTGKVLEGQQEKDRIVKSCLDQRGYKVLN